MAGESGAGEPVVKKEETLDAPDPDEDDLDDLDDMLDEFSSTKISQQPQTEQKPAPQQASAQASANGPGTNDTGQPNDGGRGEGTAEDPDFAKELEANMMKMMQDLQSNPEMMRDFEKMMSQFDGGAGFEEAMKRDAASADEDARPTPSSTSSKAPNGHQHAGQPASFQDRIKQTMERMQESNASASAASSTPGQNPDDFMAAMFKEMAQATGGDGGNEDAFSSMLLGMMEQLTNKEILYEPMKDLDTKFPGWLEEREPGKLKAASITEEERTKYKEQQSLVHDIVQRFEQPDYSDQKTEDREFIVDRMQKMQAIGAPPSDLVGDMGSAADMLSGLDSDCPQQ